VGVLLELLGGKDAVAALDRKAKRAPRAVRNAVRRIATLQSRAIKSNLKRRRTGLLARSIGSKVVDGKFGSGRVTSFAGPRRGFKVTLKTVQHKLKGVKAPVVGSIVRDDQGRVQFVGVGERLKTGKAFKFVTTANVFAARTRGKKKGQAYTIDATRYAHLIEGGHKKGKGRGAAPAFPFMRPAFEQTKGQAVAEIRAAMAEVAGA
jgi:hypothetical protein